MAYRYCNKCGQMLSDIEGYCPSCGQASPFVVQDNPVPQYGYDNAYTMRPKVPGRGFGIAGMVLGILGVVYGAYALIFHFIISKSIFQGALGDYTYDGLERLIVPMLNLSKKIASVMVVLYPLIFGVLALTFGVIAKKKGYWKGIGKSAVILGALAMLLCAVAAFFLLL